MRLLKKVVITFTLLYLLSFGYAHAQTTPKVTLAWDAVTTYIGGGTIPPNTIGYNMYRGPNADGSGATKLNSTVLSTTTYTDSSFVTTTTYYYYVTCVKLDGTNESGKSNIVKFNYSQTVFSPPTNLTIAVSP